MQKWSCRVTLAAHHLAPTAVGPQQATSPRTPITSFILTFASSCSDFFQNTRLLSHPLLTGCGWSVHAGATGHVPGPLSRWHLLIPHWPDLAFNNSGCSLEDIYTAGQCCYAM